MTALQMCSRGVAVFFTIVLGAVLSRAIVGASDFVGSATTDELKAFAGDTSRQERVMEYAMAYAKTVRTDYEAFLSDLLRANWSRRRLGDLVIAW